MEELLKSFRKAEVTLSADNWIRLVEFMHDDEDRNDYWLDAHDKHIWKDTDDNCNLAVRYEEGICTIYDDVEYFLLLIEEALQEEKITMQ
jgi:hypothetical protein